MQEEIEKLNELLKRKAPFSVVERGASSAAAGDVLECVKSPHGISGLVRESEQVAHAVSLAISSGREVGATCSCCSADEIGEQWCQHAVALLIRAQDLGFLDSRSGFAANEATFRMNTSDPNEIASVIATLSPLEERPTEIFSPKVGLLLDLSGDRLGVKLLFDGEAQGPTLFGGFSRQSSRALDNLLLRVLDEEGSWDEYGRQWFINSSKGIDTVLGLMDEYGEAIDQDTSAPVLRSATPLDARLCIEWHPASVQLSMSWILPNGEERPRKEELLGTGPYWVYLGGVIFRVAPSAARIASIFPHSSVITLPRSQSGAILEALDQLEDYSQLEVKNPELQPIAEIREPKPILELQRRDALAEHFTSKSELEIQANLEFDYPVAPADQNVVYLPDRERERALREELKERGFEQLSSRNSYLIRGDNALQLIHRGMAAFEDPWRVQGFELVKKGVRFVDLNLSISLSSAEPAKRGAIDWFDCHVSLVQNNANVPLSTLFKYSRSDNDRWITLDNGAYALVPGGSLSQLKTMLGMLDSNFKLSNAIKTRLSTAQAIGLSALGGERFSVSLDRRLRTLAEKLERFSAIKKVKPSRGFQGTLRSYQEDGLSWLCFLNEMELGGILADEMGLGKTVQALAFLQHVKDEATRKKRSFKPALVIAPTSVITNWHYEARRFAPKLKVLLLHGAGRKGMINKLDEYDIIITSYALLRLDRYELERQEFSYVVLDEAQNIKNPEAATTRAAKALRARGRLALTGTPTENRPLELWSIMDFLMPGYLGSADYFRTYVEKPILETGTHAHAAQFLNSKTKPFILRRKKQEVERDLPPKIESVLHVEMTDSQRQLYRHILEEVRPQIFDAVDRKGIRGASVSILAALLRLRQVCNHPNSIDALKSLPGYDSGKFTLLRELVEEALASGRKILLFSQFREMLLIIRRWLEETKVNYLYLDGATKDRQSLVDQFNSDSAVQLFLISLKAGGTGLNLAAADTVIIYDPWWNPAVEHQAVDRAHRIGQTRTVNVYRLVTENSVEQKIMDLKAKKSTIVNALLDHEEGISTLKLSREDLEKIFSPLPDEPAPAPERD